jgi:transcriptional regulator with XRE-family HTH domain
MAKKTKKAVKALGRPRHYLREWRDYRGLTLERLAERIGLTHGTLSKIERGKTAYTQPVLEALAEALQTTPADLIMRDPSKPNPWAPLEGVPEADRPRLMQIIQTFKTGTDG